MKGLRNIYVCLSAVTRHPPGMNNMAALEWLQLFSPFCCKVDFVCVCGGRGGRVECVLIHVENAHFWCLSHSDGPKVSSRKRVLHLPLTSDKPLVHCKALLLCSLGVMHDIVSLLSCSLFFSLTVLLYSIYAL